MATTSANLEVGAAACTHGSVHRRKSILLSPGVALNNNCTSASCKEGETLLDGRGFLLVLDWCSHQHGYNGIDVVIAVNGMLMVVVVLMMLMLLLM